MAEITALEKHGCAACGAQAVWSPSRQALVCSHCGTVAPYEIDGDTGRIREIDLVTTLRELPEELRGWAAEKRSVRCRSCHAISVFDPERVGQSCEFCGSPELVDYDEINPPIRPQSLLPFQVDRTAVRERLHGWYASRWFAPGKLRSRALVDTVHGLYVPYWTFDSRAHATWTAESGTYFYTTERVRDRNGRMRTRRVRHVRWRPVAGELDHAFDDEPIPGTRGIDLDLLRGVEPFPLGELVPYDTAYLSGFVVEHYQVVLIDAARQARAAMEGKLRELCAVQVPGDTQRNLSVEARWSAETFKHLLVPVWLVSYAYGRRRYQTVVNGATGRVAGHYPKSAWKILFLVLGALALLAALAWIL